MTVRASALTPFVDRENLLYVETGTEYGYSLNLAVQLGAKLAYSCDIDPNKVADVSRKLANYGDYVKLECAHSPTWLRNLLPGLPPGFLIVLLDAHDDQGTPILAELIAILRSERIPDVLIIDDWRYFRSCYWGFGENDVFDVLRKLYPYMVYSFQDGIGTCDVNQDGIPKNDVLVIEKTKQR